MVATVLPSVFHPNPQSLNNNNQRSFGIIHVWQLFFEIFLFLFACSLFLFKCMHTVIAWRNTGDCDTPSHPALTVLEYKSQKVIHKDHKSLSLYLPLSLSPNWWLWSNFHILMYMAPQKTKSINTLMRGKDSSMPLKLVWGNFLSLCSVLLLVHCSSLDHLRWYFPCKLLVEARD